MLGVKLPKWALPLAVGIAGGWLFSGTISRLVSQTGLPIHSMQAHAVGRRPVPVRRPGPMVRPVVRPAAAPSPVPRYVPIRRSFDRNYDSWLHTTVNSTPAIG